MNVLAGCDFFTVESLSWRGLVTYYVLFFLNLESRRVTIAGITRHPDQEWMEQIARSATQDGCGYLHPCRYVLHGRDSKFCQSFRSALASGSVRTILLPPKSPNLKAFPERWIRSVKQECLSKVIPFGEGPLMRVLTEYSRHCHHERNHQGKDNRLLFPEMSDSPSPRGRAIECRQRLGGLLKYYRHAA
jgi:putative transposase